MLQEFDCFAEDDIDANLGQITFWC